MQQGIKKLQWLEYLKVVFLEILNPLLCRVFANQVKYGVGHFLRRESIYCEVACMRVVIFISWQTIASKIMKHE